jgi:general stress protein YciG
LRVQVPDRLDIPIPLEEIIMPNNNPQGRNQYSRSDKLGSQDSELSSNTQPSNSDAEPQQAVAQSHGEAGASPGSARATRAGSGISKRGFASMDEATQREIASKGGHSQGRENNPGNFANNRERARIAGRKGGEAHGSHR